MIHKLVTMNGHLTYRTLCGKVIDGKHVSWAWRNVDCKECIELRVKR